MDADDEPLPAAVDQLAPQPRANFADTRRAVIVVEGKQELNELHEIRCRRSRMG